MPPIFNPKIAVFRALFAGNPTLWGENNEIGGETVLFWGGLMPFWGNTAHFWGFFLLFLGSALFLWDAPYFHPKNRCFQSTSCWQNPRFWGFTSILGSPLLFHGFPSSPFYFWGGHRYFYRLPPIFSAISAIFIALFAANPALSGEPPHFRPPLLPPGLPPFIPGGVTAIFIGCPPFSAQHLLFSSLFLLPTRHFLGNPPF